MKEIIISAIDLDKFIKYQNGDLVTSFADPNLEVKIEDYSESKLYKKMMSSVNKTVKQGIKETEVVDQSRVAAKQFIIKLAQAFENFKNYLRNEKITIEYYDEDFVMKTEVFDGLIARVIQHEYDHIEGILFTDLISSLKKQLIKKKLQNIMDGKSRPDYRMKFCNKKGR
jgi:hypothetical protein